MKKTYMSYFNEQPKLFKLIFIFSLITFSIILFEFTNYTEAASNTISVSAGANTIAFRDISNTQNNTVTISGTVSGSNLNIDVDDFKANLDPLTAEVVTTSATSTTSGSDFASQTLTETGPSTGIFSGTITLSSSPSSGSNLEHTSGDDVSLFYSASPPDPAVTKVSSDQEDGLAKVSIILDGVSADGTVTISDFIIDDSTKASATCPFDIVVHPVDVDLNGAITASEITITISYANGLMGSLDPSDLSVLYRPDAGTGFGVLTSTLDTNAKTVTATKDNLTLSLTPEGQYSLGKSTGCAGGGGGGLVRPGLVVNALAGLSAIGGGGSGPPGPTVTLGALSKYDSAVETISMPQEIRDIVSNHDPHTPLEPIIDTYEDFDLPFSINGNGFALGNYENTLVTQTIQPGEPTEFVVVYYTNSELAHSSLNLNSATVHGSNVQLLLFNDKPPQLIDPNGNIESFTGSINNEGELKRVATFLATFSEDAELPNPDMVIRSWTTSLSSGDTIIYDAIEIAQPEIVEIADEDIPEPEIQTLKSQYVPIWIKNNAAWWSQELIEDSDFVAGIEYLIQNEIITIQDNEIIAPSYSSNEVPEWIKNNAGWWSEDLITEKEFIDGLQWLISNGIVQVTET